MTKIICRSSVAPDTQIYSTWSIAGMYLMHLNTFRVQEGGSKVAGSYLNTTSPHYPIGMFSNQSVTCFQFLTFLLLILLDLLCSTLLKF